GSHCGYADEGTLCDLGEFLFDGMSRETQQEITHQLLLYWLGYFLKNQEDAGSAFEAYCEENADTELTTNCTLTGVTEHEVAQLLYPVPSNDWFSIGITGTLQLFDVMGKEVLKTKHIAGDPVYCGQFEAGLYYVHITHANGQVRLPLLIQHP
ncbi:MAG: T9SS type A sorting domain-containing protein, partial [Flavobacteriales bacterium]|nr:T9SS type A sorting domain-containing protein [Flavobacteriales bacterium]